MKSFLLCLLMCIAAYDYACLNEHHVTKYGKESVDGFSMHETHFYKQHNKATLEEYIKNLESQQPKTDEDILINKNSIAVSFIKLGKLDAAEKILNGLYKTHPSDYSVIINLGTLYELQGKNEKALEYIKRAVAINPQSHGGSEWFHVRVLEFKLKNFAANTIANQNILKLNLVKSSATNIAYEVQYQLQERIPFTPAPNLMMAKILEEYADFLADSVSIKGAYIIYGIAMDYDRQHVLKLNEKQNALKTYFKKYKETIPLTSNYYLDAVIETASNNTGTIVRSIVDNGINYFNEQAAKKKQRQQMQYLMVAVAVVIVTAVGILIYRRKKRVI